MGIAAISYDAPEVLKNFAVQKGITFPLLSDTGSAVIKRYGLLNADIAPDHRQFGIPYPGTFILNTRGEVTSRFFTESYQVRNTVSSIAVKVGDATDGHERDAVRLTTAHLQIVTYSTDAVVAPGSRFSLVLDVSPKARMHVYAPGSHSYTVIEVRLDPRAQVAAHRMQYPEAEDYLFKPLNERVRVYRKPFRLVQDVTVAVTPETRLRSKEPDATLAVSGVVRYQACDDKICFVPEEIPVTWTVRLKPLEQP